MKAALIAVCGIALTGAMVRSQTSQPPASATPPAQTSPAPSQDPPQDPVTPPADAQPQTAPPQAQPQPAPAAPTFAAWLQDVRTEALARGIRPEVVDAALSGIEEPLPVVIERDRSQAETVLPLDTYIARQLTPARLRTARRQFAEHRTLLEQIATKYEVPPRIIVAIWGIESNFGQFTGVRPTVAALATLAWDPRRSALFRRELFNALEILNRGDIELANLRGSWAGAMGQPQFMPSSYLQYAEDYDGDGRRDIWGTPADVFASVANYLKGYGWTPGERWGREVSVPETAAKAIAESVARREGSCSARRDMTAALPLSEWQSRGVRAMGGGPLPAGEQPASLVTGGRRTFLVYRNYDVLLDYNCAHAYALAVALLSDQL